MEIGLSLVAQAFAFAALIAVTVKFIWQQRLKAVAP
jgi:F0F1-type ATP synthase membrane subunit b/b'